MKVFFGISDAWENFRKKNNIGEEKLKRRILRNYKTYEEFKKKYSEFDQLSELAKRKVKEMYYEI